MNANQKTTKTEDQDSQPLVAEGKSITQKMATPRIRSSREHAARSC